MKIQLRIMQHGQKTRLGLKLFTVDGIRCCHGDTMTDDDRKALIAVVKAHGEQFTGDLASHDEDGYCSVVEYPHDTLPISIAGTAVASIGGHRVGGNGSYIIAGKHIMRIDMSVWGDSAGYWGYINKFGN
ncbi:MAG: hypothetical protein OXE94_04570 [Aestuariivita sp.]|nr:hypothetical protein [Aestuariivita sp.]MCY4289246.1 hypothetical protein [Aestuariivita sp.]